MVDSLAKLSYRMYYSTQCVIISGTPMVIVV